MPSIRYRSHGWVCSSMLYEVPDGETAYIKNKIKPSGVPGWTPVRWMGFVCLRGSRVLSWSRPGKLIASAVTNGNGYSGEWRELDTTHEYCRALIVQIDDSTFGAYSVVDKDCWPIVLSETMPRLTVVTPVRRKAKILAYSR